MSLGLQPSIHPGPRMARFLGVQTMALVFLACIVSGIALSLPVIRSARALGLI
jgi:hypothetical protein